MVVQLPHDHNALSCKKRICLSKSRIIGVLHLGRCKCRLRQQQDLRGATLHAKSYPLACTGNSGSSRTFVQVQAMHNSGEIEHTGHETFQGLLSQLRQLSYQELQQLCEERSPESQAAFSASFLFWLSSQEAQATGTAKQELSNIAAQLVYIKEQADWEASRRMLPPLASSLAYSNYSTWQAQHEGETLPEVAPGVSITDLYKAAEREEAKLQQWKSPQRQVSTLDSFAATSGYKQMAADAMARVRARLSGWADDDTLMPTNSSSSTREATAGSEDSSSSSSRLSPAAEKVLQQLLLGCCCREERGTVLPEAFMPPGVEVTIDGDANGPIKLVTTPQRLLAVIGHQLHEVQQQQQQQQLLPSGELLQQVLLELREDIREYDAHVYRQLSKRDIYGRL